jgi:uncharacterized protein
MNGATDVPLSQVILKVHSRCDLACDHCYVFEAADQSWRSRPRAIPDQVISRTAERIAEHARAHGLGEVQVILHGGEPLLAGLEKLRRVATELQSALRGFCRLDLRIHTNGVLLDEKFCELFAELGIKVGVSIDGDQAANDRHRRYADGRSSYDKVVRAIGLLRADRFRGLYAGLLCTIDVANDPVAVYDSLASLDPPRIDFLLPHATWDEPPVRAPGAPSQYADWLIAIYDRWLAAGRPVRIRTFDSVLSTLNGGDSQTEALGLGPVELVVIETDGSYEQVDSLKVAFDGAPATGLDVFRHALSTVAEHPGIVARQQGLAGLCRTCQECPVVASCGGGLYTHRYRAETGFDNPSVYCQDLIKLITHIRGHQPEDLARSGRVPVHTMARDDFLALAAGFGDATAVARLADAQRSLRRALLSAVYREGSNHPAVPGAIRAGLRAGWAMLTSIERELPEAVDTVLSQPYVRVWAVRCLEWLSRPSSPAQASSEPPGAGAVATAGDLAHLGAIAAAAAIRAGSRAVATLPVIKDAVYLPTLGRLKLGTPENGRAVADEPELAAVDVASDTVVVKARSRSLTLTRAQVMTGEPAAGMPEGSGRNHDWQPLRELHAKGVRVTLDDVDPYRNCYRSPVAPRLTETDFARWQRNFQMAWQEIDRVHDGYAPGLIAGLATVTPLAAIGSDPYAGAAARNAFGSVAVALPDDPVMLAFMLIREFQRAKLGAILDLYDLCHRGGSADQTAEARRIEELLASTYTKLAVTGLWRVQQKVASSSTAAETAGQRFADSSAHVRDAIQTLATSASLTPLGREFVTAMRRSADT